jgi:hypothetical protein
MATYDIETLLDDIETLLKANLNTKIAAIEAEKTALGKAVGLPSVDTNAYFQQAWSDKILNYSPAIFYGLEQIQASGSHSATLEAYKIFVEVVIVDSGMDTFTKNRIHRYSRALKEVFQENFDRLPWGNRINIETVRPISFKLEEDSSEEIKVGGVSIVTALA